MSRATGTFVLTLAIAAAWACDSNTNQKKSAGQGSAARPAVDQTQKAAGQLDATLGSHAVAVKDTTEPVGSDKTATAVRYSLVLGDSRTGFAKNAVWLTPNAKARIDEMFASGNTVALLAAHFEIEGHTDNSGTEEANRRVGLARAEAVKRYLHEKYAIAEDCITVVGYGPEQPLGDNGTEEGRAQNRRVVIKVLD
jgi:outer membrane protein OmpA-like peptidoglycan-associated protein